jgi:hypothetical protein
LKYVVLLWYAADATFCLFTLDPQTAIELHGVAIGAASLHGSEILRDL